MEEDQRGELGVYRKVDGVGGEDAEDMLRWSKTIHCGDQGTATSSSHVLSNTVKEMHIHTLSFYIS